MKVEGLQAAGMTPSGSKAAAMPLYYADITTSRHKMDGLEPELNPESAQAGLQVRRLSESYVHCSGSPCRDEAADPDNCPGNISAESAKEDLQSGDRS